MSRCQASCIPIRLDRHKFLGPLDKSRYPHTYQLCDAEYLSCLFQKPSFKSGWQPSRTLSLINVVFLVASLYLSNTADLLGISLGICRRIHRAVGWMVLALVSFHIAAMLINQRRENMAKSSQNLFAIIVSQEILFAYSLSLIHCRLGRVQDV
jgi:hypothetical protein